MSPTKEGELFKLNRALRVLSDCDSILVHAKDRKQLLDDVCRFIVETGGYRLAWVGFAEQDEAKTVRPAARHGHDKGYLDAARITWADTERGRGPGGTAIRTGKTQVNLDYSANPEMAPWRAEALKRGYRASIALPLAVDSKIFGALLIHAAETDAFGAEETKLLEKLADNLAFGIAALDTRAERDQVIQELEFKNSILTTQQDASLDAVLLVDENARILSYNRQFARLWGVPEQILKAGENEPVLQLVHTQAQSPLAFLTKVHYLDEHKQETSRDEVQLANGRIIDRYSAPVISPAGKYLGRVWYFRDITEQKQAAQALAASEVRFRALIENASDITGVIDRNGNISYISPSVKRIAGYEPDELLDTNMFAILHPDDAQSAADIIAKIVRVPDAIERAELRYLMKDGSRRTFETLIRNLLSDPAVRGIVANMRDVTERDHAEQLLRLEHNVARCLADADNASDGMKAVIRTICETKNWERGAYWRADESAAVLRFDTFWNAPGAELEGYTESSRSTTFAPGVGVAGRVWQSGEPLWVANPGGDPRVERKTLAREASMFVFPVFLEGRTIGVLAFFSREQREPDTRLLAATRVIGSQVGQFLQRKTAEDALRANERRFRALIENSADAIVVLDASGEVIYGSPASVRILGYGSDELGERSVYELVHPDDLPALRGPTAELLANDGATVAMQARIQHKDGQWRVLDGVFKNLSHDPAIGGIIANYHDITERLRSAAALQQESLRHQETARELLDARILLAETDRQEAVGRLAAGVAHEVKNPLAIIRLGVDYLTKEVARESSQAEVLQDVRRAVIRADSIITDLMQFARQKPPARHPIQICAVIDNAINLTRHVMVLHNVEIVKSYDDAMPAILADPDQLAQVFINLFTNAAHAIGLGGRIEVVARAICVGERELERDATGTFRAGARVVIAEVKDTGPGISPDHAQRLFQPFFTTKPSGEGTGLGLAVSRNIVIMHEGSINLSNRPEGGTSALLIFRALSEGTADEAAHTGSR